MCRLYGSGEGAYVRACKRKVKIPYRVPAADARRWGWRPGRCIPVDPRSIRDRGEYPPGDLLRFGSSAVFKNSLLGHKREPGRPSIPDLERQKIRRRLKRGEPYRHISEMCGVSIGTVANVSREMRS